MEKLEQTAMSDKKKKVRAENKVGIAISKLIDIIDLDVSQEVSYAAGGLLDRLRELESKIRSA